MIAGAGSACRAGRQYQEATRTWVEAGVEDFEDLDVVRCPEWVGDDLGLEGNRCGLPQHVLPERVEVIRLAHPGLVIGRHGFRHGSSLVRTKLAIAAAFSLRPVRIR